MKTTNYFNTFIEVAVDCPVQEGVVPPQKNEAKTIAGLQFELIYDNPYQFTSDQVLFRIHILRNRIAKSQWDTEHALFFAKGQACMRASPLTKRYGWGIHFDENGRMALIASGTPVYQAMLADSGLDKVKAMKSKR